MSNISIPTEPGLYWVRFTSTSPWRICEVRWYQDSSELWALVYPMQRAVAQEIHGDFLGYMWNGPLHPPGSFR